MLSTKTIATALAAAALGSGMAAATAQGYGYIGKHQAQNVECWITHVRDKPGLDGVVLHCVVTIWDCGSETPISYRGTVACIPASGPRNQRP